MDTTDPTYEGRTSEPDRGVLMGLAVPDDTPVQFTLPPPDTDSSNTADS